MFVKIVVCLYVFATSLEFYYTHILMICICKIATVYWIEVNKKNCAFRALDQSQYIELFYKQFKYLNSKLKKKSSHSKANKQRNDEFQNWNEQVVNGIETKWVAHPHSMRLLCKLKRWEAFVMQPSGLRTSGVRVSVTHPHLRGCIIVHGSNNAENVQYICFKFIPPSRNAG